jgi:ribosomal-protein-alanine N-acetyltransferase
MCRLAEAQHGITTLRAATSNENIASQKGLLNSGFVPAGPAEPEHVGGKAGTCFQLELRPTDA